MKLAATEGAIWGKQSLFATGSTQSISTADLFGSCMDR